MSLKYDFESHFYQHFYDENVEKRDSSKNVKKIHFNICWGIVGLFMMLNLQAPPLINCLLLQWRTIGLREFMIDCLQLECCRIFHMLLGFLAVIC